MKSKKTRLITKRVYAWLMSAVMVLTQIPFTAFAADTEEARVVFASSVEIYGEKGTLTVPDPNTFGGPIKLYRPEDGEVKEIPLMYPYKENSRALGLSKMAEALENGSSDFVTSWKLTGHVLDVMTGMLRSGESGQLVEMLPMEK